MNKKKAAVIGISTVLAVAGVLLAIVLALEAVNQAARENCFSQLKGATRQLAADFSDSLLSDRSLLRAISYMLSENAFLLQEQGENFMKEMPYVTYLALLTPDGILTKQDGTTASAVGKLDFQEEVQKGTYISGAKEDVFDGETMVLLNGVPVVQNGETVAMLYSVIALDQLAQTYTTDIYDGQAHVYLEDGDTGEFLLDTWHCTLGNIYMLEERKLLKGYEVNTILQDLQEGREGEFGFVSKTTGQILYMQYAPVGINNWNVLVTVDQDSAMAFAQKLSGYLYRMAAAVGGILLLYMLSAVIVIFHAYRRAYIKGRKDQSTGLYNRNAFEEYLEKTKNILFQQVTCCYLDLNGLHQLNNLEGHAAGDKMILTLSCLLRKAFPQGRIFRIGGDEFLVIHEKIADTAHLKQGAQWVSEEMEKEGYTVSMGMAAREKSIGISALVKEADEEMLRQKKRYYETYAKI